MKLLNRLLLAIVVGGFIMSCADNIHDKVKDSTLVYTQSLINRDTVLISSILDEKFRIGVYQRPQTDYLLKQILSKYERLDSITVDTIKRVDNEFETILQYNLGDGRTFSSPVRFSKEGKLLYSSLFDHLYKLDRSSKSQKIREIPFSWDEGSIILNTRLNNTSKNLRLLFDTGADGMALRSDLKDSAAVKITRKKFTHVPGGRMEVLFSANNLVHLDSVTIPNCNMVLFDKFGKHHDGIFGGAVFFRQYITEVNFDDEQIKLYSLGQFTPPEGYQSMDLDYGTGIPEITLNLFYKNQEFKSNFVFDTGAGYEAIMFGPATKRLNIHKQVPSLYNGTNSSPGKTTKTKCGVLDSLLMGNLNFPKANLAMEIYEEEVHGHSDVDGSIGIQLLRRFNWIIDLANYKLYYKPNKNYSLPLNFIIQEHMVGFNEQQQMVVKYPINMLPPNNPLRKGDIIVSIDDYDPTELNENLIEKLRKKKHVYLTIIRGEQSVTKKVKFR